MFKVPQFGETTSECCVSPHMALLNASMMQAGDRLEARRCPWGAMDERWRGPLCDTMGGMEQEHSHHRNSAYDMLLWSSVGIDVLQHVKRSMATARNLCLFQMRF